LLLHVIYSNTILCAIGHSKLEPKCIHLEVFTTGVWDKFIANWEKIAKFCEGKPPYIGTWYFKAKNITGLPFERNCQGPDHDYLTPYMAGTRS
jgi:hypothetical protein